MKEVLKQFSKFAIIGFFGTIINLVILYIFTEFFGIYYIVSSFLGFIVAMSSNFILNKIWTFEEKIKHKPLKKYFKFFIVSVIALMINLSLLYIFTEYFKIYYMFSQIIAIALSLWINFFGNKIWTFKK